MRIPQNSKLRPSHLNGSTNTHTQIPVASPRPPLPMLCPHLGSRDDPQTARSFPTTENCCHHVQPATQVKKEHQHVYCLTGNYKACPIFRQRHKVTLPKKRKSSNAWSVPLFSLILLLLLILVVQLLLFTI